MIDQYPSANGVLTSLIWRKTASGGETSLSGYDNANQALSYTPGQEQVYLNGILLVRGDDYTATNGTSITGLAALTASDYVQVNCYNNFSVASVPAASLTGTVANSQLANSSITINGTATSLGGTYTNSSASTSAAGIVQLTDSTSSTSTTTAATPASVKSAYDLANAAIPKNLTTTTGDIIYASGANTPARLGIGSTGQVLTVSGGVPSWASVSTGFVGCRAYKTSNQTVSNNTWTAINLEGEAFDTHNFHSTSSNVSRLTIPSGYSGYYSILACIYSDVTTAGSKYIEVWKGGSTSLGLSWNGNYSGDVWASMYLPGIAYLSAGEYIEMIHLQQSGASRTVTAAGNVTMLQIQYLGV